MKILQNIFTKKIIYVLLFFVGATYWYLFYFRGSPAIAHADWIKEQVYLDTIRSGIEQLLIPWAWESSFYHGVTLFMANPETTFMPDVFLLPLISNNHFIYLHHLLFYSIGFYSVNRIAQEWQLKIPSYLFLYLLFNFNGYITSHLSTGHFQWLGYYLIPGFLYYLYKSNCCSGISKNEFMAGMILGILFANGSFHIAIWLSLFSIFILIFDRKFVKKLGIIYAVGFGIGIFRILPALFYFPTASTKGIRSGYTDISLLLDSLTQLRGYGYGETTILGWWEYSLYIGFAGFFVLLFGMVLFLKNAYKGNKLKPNWVLAVFLIFLLSLGNTWSILSTLGLPLGSIERVSSRFIVIPFLICVSVTAYAIDKYLMRLENKNATVFFYILLIFISIDLFYQLLNWSLVASEIPSGGVKSIPKIEILDSVSSNYKFVVSLAWILSGCAVLTSYLYQKKFQKRSFILNR
jgi:hypothetical protein